MTEELKHRLVATAGHVDHGKTTLLEQLTGTNADRLEEEQQRGLTIDLGFAHADIGNFRVGFVDVPGHHKFVKNMVTGVGSVQGALFVVSARDGWQQQSREHFQILSLLEPDFICFSLTKIDLVDEELQLIVEAEIDEAIAGTAYEDSPVVPVSGQTGEGIEQLTGTLLELLEQTNDPVDYGKPYLPVDRVFTVEGQGTVVTGSLGFGGIETGDRLNLEPGGLTGQVRSIQAYERSVEAVRPGTRTALNVPDWERDQVERGMVITSPDAGFVTDRVDGMVWLPKNPDHRPSHDLKLMAYHGTARGEARLLLGKQMAGEQPRPARLIRKEKSFFRPGDRVILRDFGDQHVLGVLEVLTVGTSRSLQSSEYQKILSDRFPFSLKRFVESQFDQIPVAEIQSLADGSRFSPAIIRSQLESIGEITVEESIAYSQNWLEETVDRINKKVKQFHEQNPMKPGVGLSELELPESDEIRQLIFNHLSTVGIQRDGTKLKREGFEPELPEERQDQYQSLVKKIKHAGLETAEREQLENGQDELLEYGLQSGELVELSPERVIHREVYEQLVDRIRELLESEQRARLSTIRDELDSSRKYVIPLMEHLDEQGYTHRDGDFRTWVGEANHD